MVLGVVCLLGVGGAALFGWYPLVWQLGLVAIGPAVGAGLAAGLMTNLRNAPEPLKNPYSVVLLPEIYPASIRRSVSSSQQPSP